MDERRESEATPTKNHTTVERKSERELVVRRTFNGPARIVFETWTRPELFKRWWVPKSMGMFLRSCEMDVRAGGRYRLVFGHDASKPDEFFGRYIVVTSPACSRTPTCFFMPVRVMWNFEAKSVIEASALPSCSRTPRRVASESAANEASKRA